MVKFFGVSICRAVCDATKRVPSLAVALSVVAGIANLPILDGIEWFVLLRNASAASSRRAGEARNKSNESGDEGR